MCLGKETFPHIHRPTHTRHASHVPQCTHDGLLCCFKILFLLLSSLSYCFLSSFPPSSPVPPPPVSYILQSYLFFVFFLISFVSSSSSPFNFLLFFFLSFLFLAFGLVVN